MFYWHPLFFIQFTKLRKKLFGLKMTFQLGNRCRDKSNIHVIEAQAKLKHTTYEKASKMR
jgi:hypothetical protein